MKKEVSIVIVNYNGKDLLKALINSISKSYFQNYEIIIVDNNSIDGSQKFIKKNFKGVKLAENKQNLGYSGINSALKYCKGRYILFLNNDMGLDANCIGRLVKTMESDKNAAMVAPKLVNFYNKNIKSAGTWLSRAFYNGHIEKNGNPREIPYLGVGLIKKDFVNNFGYLFDPDYFIYAEDVDLGLRIRINGKKVLFEPTATAYHMHSITTQKTSRAFTTFLMERNLLITFFKILSIKNIILHLLYVLLARFVAIFKDIITFRLDLAFSRAKAMLWVGFNFFYILKKRQKTQKFRKVSDHYILNIFSEKYLFRRKFIV